MPPSDLLCKAGLELALVLQIRGNDNSMRNTNSEFTK